MLRIVEESGSLFAEAGRSCQVNRPISRKSCMQLAVQFNKLEYFCVGVGFCV